MSGVIAAVVLRYMDNESTMCWESNLQCKHGSYIFQAVPVTAYKYCMLDILRACWFSVLLLQFKGIIPIIHPHAVPNLYDFFSSAEHKRRYFGKIMLVTKPFCLPLTIACTKTLKIYIYILCSTSTEERKSCIQGRNNMRMSK